MTIASARSTLLARFRAPGDHAWRDWRLFGGWILINALPYVVIVVGGVLLEELASSVDRDLATDHQWLALEHVSERGRAVPGRVRDSQCVEDMSAAGGRLSCWLTTRGRVTSLRLPASTQHRP